VDTDVKTVSGKTENDENIDESYTNNVPNKVDNNSMKPIKLESKCNHIIMRECNAFNSCTYTRRS
jgi:hypothetical protein